MFDALANAAGSYGPGAIAARIFIIGGMLLVVGVIAATLFIPFDYDPPHGLILAGKIVILVWILIGVAMPFLPRRCKP